MRSQRRGVRRLSTLFAEHRSQAAAGFTATDQLATDRQRRPKLRSVATEARRRPSLGACAILGDSE